MPSLNKVMLMGNLTRDPELRYTPNNTAVTKFGMAINRRWRNQAGEQQEETTFVDCVSFARGAEVLNQYMQKGRPLFIEGRLNLNQWQDQEGNNRSKLEVVVENFQFIDAGGQRGGGGGGGQRGGGGRENYDPNSGSQGYRSSGGPAGAGGAAGGAASSSASPPPAEGSHEPIPEDDIPF